MNRVTEALKGKVILITGATGFLGQPLVEKILWLAPDVKRIYILIRPKKELDGRIVTAQERLKKEIFKSSVFDRLHRVYGTEMNKFLEEKLIAVSGDILSERLGLDQGIDKQLCQEIDIVINSAAVVSFDAPLDAALEGNSMSAARTAEFTNSCDGALLVHVSTAYVAGATTETAPETIYHQATGEELNKTHPHRQFSDVDLEIELLWAKIRELRAKSTRPEIKKKLLKRAQKAGRGKRKKEKIENLQSKWLQEQLSAEGMRWAQQRGWNDTYTYTKAIGEQMVLRRRDGAPTVIVRPSVIESSLVEPNPGWLDGLRMADPLIVAIGKGRLRALPLDANVSLDLIPVDMVVNALLAAIPGAKEKGGLQVYQVATGDTNPVTLGELHDMVYGYFRKNPMLDKKGNPIQIKPLKFHNPTTFWIQHQMRRFPLRAAELALTKIPLNNRAEKFKRKVSAARATYDRLYYYGQIYGPYLNLNCRFEVKNTLQLFDSLSEHEKKELSFDISSLNWRHYIQDVHIPGVKKYILKMEESSSGGFEEASSTDTPTINALLSRAADRFPDKTALQIKRDGVWKKLSYKELRETALKIGGTLQQAGLRKGDRVVLFSENKPEWGAAHLGALSIGAVVVPLDAQTWHKEVWSVVRFTEAKAVLASSRCLARLTPEGLEANEKSKSPARLLNVDQGCVPFNSEEHPRSTEKLEDISPSQVEVNPDDPAAIIFTNSTAVDPKGVIHTHQNFINNLLGVNRYLPASEKDQLLSVLPLNHVLEFTCGFLMALHAGATVSYLNSLKPRAILGTMKEIGATCMIGVPTLYALIREDTERRLLRAPKSTLKSNLVATSKRVSQSVEKRLGKNIGRQLFARVHREFGGQVRFFVSGGSALGEGLYEDFQTLGMPIYEGYGLTETAPVLSVNPLHRSRKGSAGQPLPGVELRIHSPDRKGTGEIIARSPSLMTGYYRNPGATEAAIKDGWFHTGDLGRIDADGYVYVTGRKKDVIVTGAGKNVYPVDLEAIYRGLPSIEEVCVVGIKSGLTEDIHAAVVPTRENRSETDPDETKRGLQKEIQALARELPSYHRLQRVHAWAEPLPRTDSGEIDREKVRQVVMSALDQGPGADKQGPSPQNQEEELFAELSRLSGIPVQDIGEDSHLYSDLGFDSLMAIEFLLYVERAFGVSVPDQVATGLQTAGQVLTQARLLSPAQAVAVRPKPIRSARPYAKRSAADRWLLTASFATLKSWYRLYFQLRLHNPEHLPHCGPYLIAANHSSHLDAAAVIASVAAVVGARKAGRLHVLGARDYFFNRPLKGWILSALLNLVPVEREETSLAGLRLVKALLAEGESVLIFPEGTRSRTGQIQDFKPGVGLIAAEAGAPIVPLYIQGAHRAMPPGAAFPRPLPIEVFFGPAINVSDPDSAPQASGDELYRRIAAEVQRAVVTLAQPVAERE
ncbi:MAG: AMP-binding protein [Acidobacteriota bacterium]